MTPEEKFKTMYLGDFSYEPLHCPKSKDGVHHFKYDRDFKPLYCKKCKITIQEINNNDNSLKNH